MPTADEAAVREQEEFYRLYTPVTSPGDIWEVDVSARAIYVGPQSDIAEVNVQYADNQAPLGARNAIVSVNGPWPTRLDVDLTQRVSSTNQPQRLLISPVDIVDLAYQRPTAGPAPSRRFNVPPYLDLMFALNPPQAIPQVRADRTIRFPQVPYGQGAAASTDVVIPIYGRRMVSFQLTTAQEFTAAFYLVALQPGQVNQYPKSLGSISQVLAADVRTSTVVFRASDQVALVTDSAAVTYSDSPLPSAKGQADLIVVNISRAGVAGDQYVDLFVKLSDRES